MSTVFYNYKSHKFVFQRSLLLLCQSINVSHSTEIVFLCWQWQEEEERMVGMAYSFIKLIERKIIVKEILIAYSVFFMDYETSSMCQGICASNIQHKVLSHLCFCTN